MGLALGWVGGLARANEEDISFKKRAMDEKRFVAAVGEAIVKAAHGTARKIALLKYDYSHPKPNRSELAIKMEYSGAVTGKRYVADIVVKIDSTDKEAWEVLNIDYFPLEVSDFGPAITKIQAAKPNFVMSVLVGGNHISFYRQWAAAGMNKTVPVASTTFGNGLEQQVTTPEEHKGYIAAQSYFQEVDTPANKEFLKKFLPKYGATSKYVTSLAIQTYHGMHLWALGVKKANSVDRMKVIEALESNVSFSGPAGKTAIDPQTHHCSLDVYIAEAQNRTFKVVESWPQQPPADTAAVCNLKKNPNDNQQYVIDVK